MNLLKSIAGAISIRSRQREDIDSATRVLESIKAGKRLPEARFSIMTVAPKSQKSVYGMFQKADSRSDLEVATNV